MCSNLCHRYVKLYFVQKIDVLFYLGYLQDKYYVKNSYNAPIHAITWNIKNPIFIEGYVFNLNLIFKSFFVDYMVYWVS
jgi:hypothetical protein